MKNIKKKLAASLEVLRLIAAYTPEYFLFFAPSALLSAFLPLLYVYAPKLIIEALTGGEDYGEAVKIIAFFCGTALVFHFLIGYFDKKSKACAEKFSVNLSAETGRIVMNLSLSELESTSERDNIRLAGNAAGTIGLCEAIKELIQKLLTLGGLAALISRLDLGFFAVVALLFVVKILFTTLNYKAGIRRRLLSARNDREGEYLASLCYFNQGAAKEIRTNGIETWFLGKVRAYRRRMVEIQCGNFQRNWVFDSVNAFLFALSSLYILWSLSSYYLDGRISIADFTLYFSSVTAVTATLGTITELVARYNEGLRNTADFRALSRLAAGKGGEAALEDLPFDRPKEVEIVFSNVRFAYPGGESEVLRGISIKITNREKLVVVGHNGAGKSTFIKLLCKFYRPTAGKITLNGRDVWEIPNEVYYRTLGAVFQDFTTFAFTISENISGGERNGSLPEALVKAGLFDFVESLPKGSDTYVSKQYSSDGIELSGGQGQKMALARALYRNAPVLILDEPTASLDVRAESELYESFMKTAADKTAIFISHRLAASRIADHIAVFSDGKIAEYGTHGELTQRRGLYADMFEKQSRAYAAETKEE